MGREIQLKSPEFFITVDPDAVDDEAEETLAEAEHQGNW